MNKTDLRHYYLQKRLTLSVDDVDFLSQVIRKNFFNIKTIQQKEVFHTFLPIAHNKEINTWPIINELWDQGKKVIAPVSDFTNFQMTNFYLEKHTRLGDSKFGIPEPVDGEIAHSRDIQVVIIPLLAFDLQGYRVGYGKGFYDKFLSCLDVHVVRIGLSFFDPTECVDDAEEWDEKLHFCVTPTKVHEF